MFIVTEYAALKCCPLHLQLDFFAVVLLDMKSKSDFIPINF